jgi:hypothetical protein
VGERKDGERGGSEEREVEGGRERGREVYILNIYKVYK